MQVAVKQSVWRRIRHVPAFPLLLGIRIYQKTLSGRTAGRNCRFDPTCSEYALQALHRYGLLKGLSLTRHRLARCNPDYKGGYDPVP